MVVTTRPESGDTDVPVTSLVEIEFSERVDHTRAEESIFMTPLPPGGVEFSWKGRRLILERSGSLPENRTFVITVGTGTRDMRNNPMTESYTFAFSTGARLDSGRLEGAVYASGSLVGTQIWAYDLAETPDPDPGTDRPLYRTQTAESGAFRLTHMAPGRYRTFAVTDRDGNDRYDPEYDLIGVPFTDTDIRADADPPFLSFRIARRDTTLPQLISVESPDRRHVNVRFSESMSSWALENPKTYQILQDTDTLSVLSAYLNDRNPAVAHLLTSPQVPDQTYRFSVSRGRDLAGLSLDTTFAATEFTASALSDTVSPTVVERVPADSSVNVMPDPEIELMFSEAMDSASVRRYWTLHRSGGDAVPGVVNWLHPARCRFIPDASLEPGQTYHMRVEVDSITDVAGNALGDTVISTSFETVRNDTLSAISGRIIDPQVTHTGSYVVTARSVNGHVYTTSIPSDTLYRFDPVLPGIFLIEVYHDRNDDGRYDLGHPSPFDPSERFVVYGDSVIVRSRWPNEGNDIALPETFRNP
jgi:hypothetical protein